MNKFFDSLKQTFVNGTTWGTVGVAGLIGASAGAQSLPAFDPGKLTPGHIMWLYVATMVLQFGFETVKLLLTRSDDKNKQQEKKK